MARMTKKQIAEQAALLNAQLEAEEAAARIEETQEEAEAELEMSEDEALEAAEEEEKRTGGVVKSKYKKRYAERGDARGCGDWLQKVLKPLTLDGNNKLRVAEFEAILDANGVRHAHWNRTTNGWQGRLRMSGGMALRTKVAAQGALYMPDGTQLEAPLAFCDKHIH